MAQRKRIGLSYTYNENWIGGTYYIENLVSALNTLPDEEKPHLVIIINNQKDHDTAKAKLSYPYISYQLGSGESNKVFRLFNKVSNRLLHKKPFNQRIKNLDAVFPYYDCVQQSLARKKIYWIADFQEHFAPEYFTKELIDARKTGQDIIQASSDYLILSSKNAYEHFKTIYPDFRVQTRVLPFAVTHPDYSSLNIQSLLTKHKLPARFLMCPNQFWKHKNQLVVLKAISQLKAEGIEIVAAFTGNTSDYRNPHYYNELKAFVDQHDLAGQARFLGFIDRAEQLQLMNHSLAVIQPSLFEGWSTVVEDARSMNKFLIVSDIPVHREQLENSAAMFFDPLNANVLADAIKKTISLPQVPTLYEVNNYPDHIKQFGTGFMSIINNGINSR